LESLSYRQVTEGNNRLSALPLFHLETFEIWVALCKRAQGGLEATALRAAALLYRTKPHLRCSSPTLVPAGTEESGGRKKEFDRGANCTHGRGPSPGRGVWPPRHARAKAPEPSLGFARATGHVRDRHAARWVRTMLYSGHLTFLRGTLVWPFAGSSTTLAL